MEKLSHLLKAIQLLSGRAWFKSHLFGSEGHDISMSPSSPTHTQPQCLHCHQLRAQMLSYKMGHACDVEKVLGRTGRSVDYNKLSCLPAKYQRRTQREGGRYLGLVELQVCDLHVMVSRGNCMVNAKPAGKEECTLTTSCLPRVLIQLIVLSTWAGPGSWNGQGMPCALE